MKKIIILIAFHLLTALSYCQNGTINLVKGSWKFCVLDSLAEPLQCETAMMSYDFKRSGKYVVKGFSMFKNGKTITHFSGRWTLSGGSLELVPDDRKTFHFDAKTIQITTVDGDTFYSPQPDAYTVYWLFKRK